MRRLLSGPRGLLQVGYASGLAFTMVLTLLAVHTLTTVEFATLTKALIISAVVPLLVSGGVSDAVTFTALRSRSVDAFSAVGLILTTSLALLGTAIALPYAAGQGLTATEAVLTAAISALAIIGMTCQAIELIHGLHRRVASMAALPALLGLLIFIPLMMQEATASDVLLARVVGAAVVTFSRVFMLRRHLSRPPAWADARLLLRIGLPIYLSSVLAAGGLRLEQALVLHFFPESAIAAYGLVLPVINGIRTLLYGAGTVAAVELAKTQNDSLMNCHQRAAPLWGFAGAISVVSTIVVLVVTSWVGLTEGMPAPAVFGFVLGGALSGMIDVLVRMYRGSGDALYGVMSRAVGLAVTGLAGPALMEAGVQAGALTGLISGSLAYLTLLAGLRKDRR